jgi:hypothetical protein
MRPRASERDFFRALRRKWAFAPQIRLKASSLRSAGRQGSSPLCGAPLVPRSASLTAALAPAPVLPWGAGLPRFIQTDQPIGDCQEGGKLVET